jgi:hypothetical protein
VGLLRSAVELFAAERKEFWVRGHGSGGWEGRVASAKIPWKKVSEFIEGRGGFKFGYATCRKKWDEVNAGARGDEDDDDDDDEEEDEKEHEDEEEDDEEGDDRRE